MYEWPEFAIGKSCKERAAIGRQKCSPGSRTEPVDIVAMRLRRREEGRRFEFVFLGTLIAGFWSLMSGLVLVMTLQACGLLLA